MSLLLFQAAASDRGRLTCPDLIERTSLRPSFNVGPTHPLDAFPPVLFSSAFDFAQQIERVFSPTDLSLVEPDPTLRRHLLIALCFDLNRELRGHRFEDPIRVVRRADHHGSNVYLIQLYNRLVLAQQDGETAPKTPLRQENLFLGTESSYLLRHDLQTAETVTSAFVDEEKELVARANKRLLMAGNPALVFPECRSKKGRVLARVALEFMAHYRNSPYNSQMQQACRDAGKRRFVVIDALHHLRKESSAAPLMDKYISRFPPLLAAAGWCGGIMLHEAAQYGNKPLVELLILRAREQSAVGKLININGARYEFKDWINWKNRDGSTPLHLATLYEGKNVVDLLIDAGADPMLFNRFGDSAYPEAVSNR